MLSVKRSFVLQIIFLLGLAWASGYQLPSFEDSNWQTVLFLTPSGIISNFLTDPVLSSFYFDISKGQSSLANGRGAILAGIWLLLFLNGLHLIRQVTR